MQKIQERAASLLVVFQLCVHLKEWKNAVQL